MPGFAKRPACGRFVVVTQSIETGGPYARMLRHYRRLRGLSQTELAELATVSPRHLSFLETGRAFPSREMVLRLANALDVPLGDRNAQLVAAGFAPAFRQAGPAAIPAEIRSALARMMEHHEPYPLAVMDSTFDVRMTNRGALRLLSWLVGPKIAEIGTMNAIRSVLDPEQLRPYVVGWEGVARSILARLQREVMRARRQGPLAKLLEEIESLPDVPKDVFEPNADPMPPAFMLELEKDGKRLAFLTTLTKFSDPQSIDVEDIQIESYYPADDATDAFCRELAS